VGAKVYRDYDQEALDGQFNLRARWPQFQLYFDRWSEESAAARARLDGHLDLTYGPSAGQRLDIFPAPQGAGTDKGAPLVAFIHGGYWQALDKSDFSYLAPTFVDAGIAFASLNYDLAPQVSVEEIVRQVRAAIVWLSGHAGDYGADPERIYVAGHSAGGHLTAMALATAWTDWPDAPSRPVKGGCSVSGVYELEPLWRCYQQEVLKLDAGMVARNSPQRLAPPNGVPLICAVGSEETEAFHDQQRELAATWGDQGLPVQVVELPGRNHFTAVDGLFEADHPLFAAFRRMIQERA
jgi:arylformamidase